MPKTQIMPNLQITFSIFTTPNTTGSDHVYNTLELLMMGIMVPETWWASNKICNKYHLLHLVGILFPHIDVSSFVSFPVPMYHSIFKFNFRVLSYSKISKPIVSCSITLFPFYLAVASSYSSRFFSSFRNAINSLYFSVFPRLHLILVYSFNTVRTFPLLHLPHPLARL